MVLAAADLDIFHVALDTDPETPRSQVTGDEAFHPQIVSGEIDPGTELFRLEHVDTYTTERAWRLEAAGLAIDAVTVGADQVAERILLASPAQR